jgi:hypothetical protein
VRRDGRILQLSDRRGRVSKAYHVQFHQGYAHFTVAQRFVQPLLLMSARAVEKRPVQVIEYIRAENRILRSKRRPSIAVMLAHPGDVGACVETHCHTGAVVTLPDYQSGYPIDIETLSLVTEEDLVRPAGDDRRCAAEIR